MIINQLCKKILFSLLTGIQHGQLQIVEHEQTYQFGSISSHCPLHTVIHVHHPKFYRHIILGGSVGGGEAYMAGDYTCDNLVDLMRIFIVNRHLLERMERGFAYISRALYWLKHLFHRNTRQGSRENIHAHYDLGNDFFALFLDKRRMYSCAMFDHIHATLDQAAEHKLQVICQKLQLKSTDHVLEIGCGWGGFAIYAAQHYRCHITTTTISQQQHAYVKKRVQELGLNDRVEVLLEDYRDLTETYDKLVSIEMIEAVGHQYLDQYIKICNDCLKPNGLFLLQAITIADRYYAQAVREVDFIKYYIFPGGFLPSITAICKSMMRTSTLSLIELNDMGNNYVLTLQHWRERFLHHLPQIKQLGYNSSFINMWLYYLCYCEAGFSENYVSAIQILFRKNALLTLIDSQN